jgi:hypothetical protein
MAMAALVITAITMVFPRFDVTDTMRPWNHALASLVPQNESVCMYKPSRWAEYGLQYYRDNYIQTAFSEDELVSITEKAPRLLCITEDKKLEELSKVTAVDLEVVHAIGGQTAFWIWKAK